MFEIDCAQTKKSLATRPFPSLFYKSLTFLRGWRELSWHFACSPARRHAFPTIPAPADWSTPADALTTGDA